MSIDTAAIPASYTSLSGNRKTLTVLQLLAHFDASGPARLALEFSSALVATGGQAHIAFDGATISTHELVRNGVKFTPIKLAKRNPLSALNTARRVARFATENGVDIIHAQNASLAVIGHAAAKKAGCRLVTTFHDGPNSLSALSKRSLAAFAGSDHVVTPSRTTAAEIARILPDLGSRISVVPYGIDFSRFDAAQVTAPRVIQLAQQWRVPEDLPVIMLPARFERDKGQSIVVEALSLIRTHDLRCILVGPDGPDGAYREKLTGEIARHDLSDRILLAEEVRDMPAALMLADVVLAPYLAPAMYNRVILEAQALGRPVVASDFPCAHELLEDSSMAWIIPPGDAEALSIAISEALALGSDERNVRAAQVIANLRSRADRLAMNETMLGIYLHLAGKTATA